MKPNIKGNLPLSPLKRFTNCLFANRIRIYLSLSLFFFLEGEEIFKAVADFIIETSKTSKQQKPKDYCIKFFQFFKSHKSRTVGVPE